MRGKKQPMLAKPQQAYKSMRLFANRTLLATLSLTLASANILFVFVHPEKVDAAPVTYVASASATSGVGTSILINKPTGTVENDVLVATVAFVGSSGYTVSPPGGGGWTLIKDVSTSGYYPGKTYYKVAGSSEPASYTFTVSSSTNAGVGGIVSYRNVNTSSPIDGNSALASGSSSTHVAPATTTTASETRTVVIYNQSTVGTGLNMSWTATTPSTMSERVDTYGNFSTSYIGLGFYDISQNDAGAMATKTATSTRSSSYTAFQFALVPADPTRMLLYWDGGAAPSGWSFVSEANDKFIRGESPANYGLTGGAATHATTASVTVGPADTGSQGGVRGGTADSAATAHTHTATASIGSANNLPAYRTLRLMRFDAGIPNNIPAGAIALFDDSPGIIPPQFTRYSAQDGSFVRSASTSGSTGGSNTHTHTITWSSLAASAGEVRRTAPLFLNNSVASNAHTHNAPAATTTSTNGTSAADCEVEPVGDSCLPPYVNSILAKANEDTPTLSIGITAMFDADPGGGWVVRSDSGGSYYQKFMRGSASYDEVCGQLGIGDGTCGEAEHTHVNATTTSTNNNGGGSNALLGLGSVASPHNHVMTAAFNPANNIPEYYNVVVAEKINFIQHQYRWFVDSDLADVTDPWSSQDIPQNTAITVVPVANDAPRANRELRLRTQILVGNNDLAANGIEFKLQYKLGTDGLCTTGSWQDIGDPGSGLPWRYAASSVANGADLNAFPSRINSPTSNVMQIYVKDAGAGTNPRAVSVGQYAEYDFHIMHNGADGSSRYSFRMVEDSGILLSQYDSCPTLVAFPDTEDQLRHGNFFENGLGETGFSWSD